MRFFISLMLALLCLASEPASAGGRAPEIGRYVKVYSGGEGVTVHVLRYGPEPEGQALVQVSGIDHPIDRRILLAKVEPTQRGSRYLASMGGRSYRLLEVSDGVTELLVTGGHAPVSLRYDKKLSDQEIPAHFLTAFQEQATAK